MESGKVIYLSAPKGLAPKEYAVLFRLLEAETPQFKVFGSEMGGDEKAALAAAMEAAARALRGG